MAASTTTIDQTPALSYNSSPDNISGAQKEFQEFLSQTGVIVDPDQCHSRAGNAWTPADYAQKPAIVLQPSCTQHVSAIMKICSKRRIPVTSYSGGTSLPGALISTRGGICIDFKNMSKILCIHEKDMDAVVQPGLGWRELNEQLENEGFFFPPDPSPDACIGGMVSRINING